MYKNRNSRKRKKQHYCENIVTQPLIKGDKPFDATDSQIHRIYSPSEFEISQFWGLDWIGFTFSPKTIHATSHQSWPIIGQI